MVKVATLAKVDRIIYGRIEGTNVTLKLLVAQTQQVVEWSTNDLRTDPISLRATAREAMASLLSRSP